MDRYYERLWQSLPATVEPYRFQERWRFLRSQLQPGWSVLDLGCGAGAFTAALARDGFEVTAADVAQAALKRAIARTPEARFQLISPDLALPFDDASFDAIWVSEVLERVFDLQLMLSELRRVLKTGGLVVVTTPAHSRASALRLLLQGFEHEFDPLEDRIRRFTARSLKQLLQQFGFTEVVIDYEGRVPLRRRTLLACGRRQGWGATSV